MGPVPQGFLSLPDSDKISISVSAFRTTLWPLVVSLFLPALLISYKLEFLLQLVGISLNSCLAVFHLDTFLGAAPPCPGLWTQISSTFAGVPLLPF